MLRHLASTCAVATALLLSGCSAGREARRAPTHHWEGGLLVQGPAVRQGVLWNADAVVGAGGRTAFERVGADRWRGAGGAEYRVEGLRVRSAGRVAELVETAEGWSVRVHATARPDAVQTFFFARAPARSSGHELVRVAHQGGAERTGRSLFVREGATAETPPWPQLGLALIGTGPTPAELAVPHAVTWDLARLDREINGNNPRPAPPKPHTESWYYGAR